MIHVRQIKNDLFYFLSSNRISSSSPPLIVKYSYTFTWNAQTSHKQTTFYLFFHFHYNINKRGSQIIERFQCVCFCTCLVCSDASQTKYLLKFIHLYFNINPKKLTQMERFRFIITVKSVHKWTNWNFLHLVSLLVESISLCFFNCHVAS